MEYLYAVMEIFTEYFILLNICMNMEYLKPRFGVHFFFVIDHRKPITFHVALHNKP